MMCSSLMKVTILLLIQICLLVLPISVQGVHGKCVTFDEVSDPSNGCTACMVAKERKPRALTSTTTKVFEEVCGDVFKQDDGSTYTCCNKKQIKTLSESLTVSKAVLDSCPSCWRNFKQYFCHLTCSPNQSEFLEITKIVDYSQNSEIKIAKELNYYVTEYYINGTYDSCRNVIMPSTNGNVMDMLCGKYGAASCTPYRLFEFLGSTSNGYSPADIVPQVLDSIKTQYQPMNVETIPCYKGFDNETACSCVNCIESCGGSIVFTENTIPYIGSLSTITFACILGFIACMIVFASFSYFIREHLEDSKKSFLHRRIFQFKLGTRIENDLQTFFSQLGFYCAKYPVTSLVIGACICVFFSSGIIFLQLVTDPIELWASPESQTRKDKDYFDNTFGPFYRTNQIIIKPNNPSSVEYVDNNNNTFLLGPVFDQQFLLDVLDIQNQIESNIFGIFENEKIFLKDVCLKPLYPDNVNCSIMSILNYFQNNPENIRKPSYLDHLLYCIRNPTAIMDNNDKSSCFGTFDGPVFPYIGLGDFTTSDSEPLYETSKALVITFPINNYNTRMRLGKALSWEASFLSFMEKVSSENNTLDLAYFSERSAEDELNRASQSDILTILISYIVMFIYVAIALKDSGTCCNFISGSKISLGLCGVLLVLSSVLMALGVCGHMGIEVTIIAIEVIPFLSLAVGVDNIFIFVKWFDRNRDLEKPIESQISSIIGYVGPSVLIASFSECLCFFLGAMTDMPAVKSFSIVAGFAILFNFILQITCFVSLIAVDCHRAKARLYDVCCCIRASKSSKGIKTKAAGKFYTFFQNIYGPFILNTYTKHIIIVIFTAWFWMNLDFFCNIEIGLDQQLAMPKDSYLQKYFQYMFSYLSVGPPIYFVLKKDFNLTPIENQNKICSSIKCNNDSMLTQIYSYSLQPEKSYIARPANSWIDDYYAWLRIGNDVTLRCCRKFKNSSEFCPKDYPNAEDCEICSPERPSELIFNKYINNFLQDNPGVSCPKGGHAAYAQSVKLTEENYILDNNFMTYHTVLKTTADFYNAYSLARQISNNITTMLNKDSKGQEVFPYSIFYIYYEQYLTMWEDTLSGLFASLAAIFVTIYILLGLDLYSAVIIIMTIIGIVVDLGGVMYLWNIPLNAISLVNLITAMGISVEFCCHIVRHFAHSDLPTKTERAEDALTELGSVIFSGVTMTKFGGIIVLYFAKSQLFQIFYFRMYLMIVVIGAIHSTVFLPAFLSFFGPPNRQLDDE